MAGNSFGQVIKLTSFGESHGKAMGGIIDGFPAGVEIDECFIQKQLNRRKPGQSELTTQRKEQDKLEILSGIFDGISLGTPIAFVIRNKDARSSDYSRIKDVYRPSHADYTYDMKYGLRDYRGGGRSSARETISRVVAGAFAQLLLIKFNIRLWAYTSAIGTVECNKVYSELDPNLIDENEVRCPDSFTADQMRKEILVCKDEHDSVGGSISCVIQNLPFGLGEPVFDKLQADLAKALMSINAAKGFEYGMGFSMSRERGSRVNDSFTTVDGEIVPETNFSGGIQGGISNGADIYCKVAFKPVATIMQDQKTVDSKGKEINLQPKGRHDVCVVPRAVPIVESMAALVIADHLLRNRLAKI
ncbi:MAG: chorismate synthase [Bacteroidales bacterium]